MNWLYYFLMWATTILFSYFLFIQSYYLFLLFLAIPEIYKRFTELNVENFEKIFNLEKKPEYQEKAALLPFYLFLH